VHYITFDQVNNNTAHKLMCEQAMGQTTPSSTLTQKIDL